MFNNNIFNNTSTHYTGADCQSHTFIPVVHVHEQLFAVLVRALDKKAAKLMEKYRAKKVDRQLMEGEGRGRHGKCHEHRDGKRTYIYQALRLLGFCCSGSVTLIKI